MKYSETIVWAQVEHFVKSLKGPGFEILEFLENPERKGTFLIVYQGHREIQATKQTEMLPLTEKEEAELDQR